jgi:hypothetical protein
VKSVWQAGEGVWDDDELGKKIDEKFYVYCFVDDGKMLNEQAAA